MAGAAEKRCRQECLRHHIISDLSGNSGDIEVPPESRHGRQEWLRHDGTRRGGALLAVLWLSAALAAIAFSVATTVRGEVERASTHADGVKSYFLARGAVDRALLWMLWSDQYRNPDGSYRYYTPGATSLNFEFPNGAATVQILPETAKLNVNTIVPDEMMRLLIALGVEPERARVITAGILDWRVPAPQSASEFDGYYLSQTPSFRARHASLEEIEEILSIRGVTPDLFHGTWVRDQAGKLVPQLGLKDCLSVWATGQIDVNSAPPAVFAAIGLPPDAIAAIVETRRLSPFSSPAQLNMLTSQLGSLGGRLIMGRGSMVTLKASARLRLSNGQLSDMKRSVSAVVKFGPSTKDAPYHIIRWHDQAGLSVGDQQ